MSKSIFALLLAATFAQIAAPSLANDSVQIAVHAGEPLRDVACRFLAARHLDEVLIPPDMDKHTVPERNPIPLQNEGTLFVGALTVVDASKAIVPLTVTFLPRGQYKYGHGNFAQFYREGDGTPLIPVTCAQN